jgi:hypothetical protein
MSVKMSACHGTFHRWFDGFKCANVECGGEVCASASAVVMVTDESRRKKLGKSKTLINWVANGRQVKKFLIYFVFFISHCI